MKDFLKIFKTVMDKKVLVFLSTMQSSVKRSRLIFFFATVIIGSISAEQKTVQD